MRNPTITTTILLSLLTACSSPLESQQASLASEDFADDRQQICVRTVGDYLGDASPPPIRIPLGHDELDAASIFQAARNQPEDPRAGLLARYASLVVAVEQGADLSAPEVDLLVGAELVLLESSDDGFHPDLPDLIHSLDAIAARLVVEVPCRATQDGLATSE